MLAYAHINLLSMLSRFTPDEAVRVATDNIYVRTSALKKLEGVEAFIPMKKCDCVPGLLGLSTFPRSRQPNGVIRTRSSKCPWNMLPTSPSLIIKQTQKEPLSQHRAAPRRPAVEAPLELPKWWWGQRQNHASD